MDRIAVETPSGIIWMDEDQVDDYYADQEGTGKTSKEEKERIKKDVIALAHELMQL